MNWILCPLLNGLHLTKRALPTFLAQDIGDVRVWFLDNGSTDGTREWLYSTADERVKYTIFPEPKSVAASWNHGLHHLFRIRTGVESVLVCNLDVELRPDTYRHLVNDGSPFVTAVGTSDRAKIDPPNAAPDPAKKRPNPDYSCFLISRKCWQRVPFDEEFLGGYVEDAAHHVSLHRAGITAMALELPFYHVASGTIKSSEPAEVERIQQAAERNRALFKRKYGCEVGSPEYYALFGSAAPTS